MGKREIRPLATPKPLNRSSQKVAHVITSWISTDMRNFSRDPSRGFFSPYARNCASKCLLGFFFFFFFSFFFWGGGFFHAWTDFHALYVKRRGSAQGCAFSGLEDKTNIYTRNSRKTAIFEPDFDGTENFRPKTALQWGCSHVNSP